MILKVGSNGDDVKKLQTKLGLSSDGIFGNGTEESVKSFQTKNGLTPDGIVGEGTWKKLFPSNEINLTKLKGHIPDGVLSQIPETMSKFNINTPLRLAHFLSQCSHESIGFTAVKENVNYSADGLKKIFPKYFPGNLSESYARNPEKIASKVYGGRMGNGDESTKEGWKFRGRGYLQLTGKVNYSAFGKSINEDTITNPDIVATKYPLLSAAWFFTSNNLWSICDKGSSVEVITQLTKRINGGKIGLDDRIKEFKEYHKLLS
jgi:putative chitinase